MAVRRCRYCESLEVYELPLGGVVEAAFLPPLFLRPYRCNRCLRKQIGFRFIKPMMRNPHVQRDESSQQTD